MCSARGCRGLPCRVSPFGYLRINSRYQSPQIFAVNYVLHRLMVPRHPSCARIRLTETLLPKKLASLLRALSRTGSSVYVAISTQFYSIVKELAPAPGCGPAAPTRCAEVVFDSETFFAPSTFPVCNRVVGVTGIGPVTSSLSGTRSNQLSYTPGFVSGGGNRDRTGDLMLAKHVLYQLSYAPVSRLPGARGLLRHLRCRHPVEEGCGGIKRCAVA